jgi:hypothetical protein
MGLGLKIPKCQCQPALSAPAPAPAPQQAAKPGIWYVVYAILGTISRKTSDSTEKFNGQNPLNIAVTNALEFLRGQNFEN